MKPDRSNIEAWLLDRIEGRLTPAQERELTAFLLAHPDLVEELGELPSVEKDVATFTGKDELKRTLPPIGEVTAENLDDFLVAHGEGDLDGTKRMELERYLAAHPEAAKAARWMDAARVTQEHIAFEPKSTIARTFPPQGMPDSHRMDDFLVAKLHGELGSEQERALVVLIAADAAIAKAWAVMRHTRVAADRAVFAGKEALKKREVKVIPLWNRPAMRYAAAASVALLIGLWWFDRDVDPQERLAEDPAVKEQPAIAPQVDEAVAPIGEAPQHRAASTDATDRPVNEGIDTAASPAQAIPVVPQSPDRNAPPRIDRMDPLLASRAVRSDTKAPRTAPVPEVPVSSDAPTDLAAANDADAMTVGELLAGAFRNEVLEQPTTAPRDLDGRDALALADKGLQAIGGAKAGVSSERIGARRRFNLRLGEGLAIATSTGR